MSECRELNPPPDPVLLPYDEIMGVLGEDWEMMTGDWRCVITQDAPVLSPGTYYPGSWIGMRHKDLPYLHLRRKSDGQRVRFEVPEKSVIGTNINGDYISEWLRWVRDGRYGYRAHRDSGGTYSHHVTWLDSKKTSAGSEGAAARKDADSAPSGSDRRPPSQPAGSGLTVAVSNPNTKQSEVHPTTLLPEPVADWAPQGTCAGCGEPFNAYRREAGRSLKCGDCYTEWIDWSQGKLREPLDTRIAEAQPEETETRGAWETPTYEGEC